MGMSEHEDSLPLLPIETLKRIGEQTYPYTQPGTIVQVLHPLSLRSAPCERVTFPSRSDVGSDVPGGGAV